MRFLIQAELVEISLDLPLNVCHDVCMKAIGILIDPQGDEWFDAYGPLTKDRSKATVFVSPEIANKAAQNRMGRLKIGFWNCEREHERLAEIKYRQWTNRVESIESPLTSH